jgi:hypothetical protein
MTKHGIDVNRKFKEILRDLQTAVKESKGQNNDDSKTKPKGRYKMQFAVCIHLAVTTSIALTIYMYLQNECPPKN